MIAMGYTKRGDARHLIVVLPPVDDDPAGQPALCGANIVRLVRNWDSHQIVEYADHWRNSGTSLGGDLCSRCEHEEGRRGT